MAATPAPVSASPMASESLAQQAPSGVDRARVAAAVGALAATMVAGLLPQGSAFALFILGVGASLLLVKWAFPSMWLYALWLAAVYALAFIGATVFALSAAVRSPLVGPVPLFAGLVGLLEFVALYIGLSLFAEVKSIRDFRTRLSITRGDDPPEYARIGLWTLCLVAFFLMANLSALLLVAWVRDAPVLWAHAAVEALVIGLGVYILYVPESAFGVLPREYRQLAKAQPRGMPLVGVTAAGTLAPMAGPRDALLKGRCPVCEGPLTMETRACPACASAADVGWCPKSEVHVVDCEHCHKPVVYGKVVCAHCHGELKQAFLCKACKTHHPLSDWKLPTAV